MPAISFSRVDLPEPFCPTIPNASPGRTCEVDVAQRPELTRLRQRAPEDRLLQRAGRRQRDLEPPADAAADDLAGRDLGSRLRARPQYGPRSAARPRARSGPAWARRERCRGAASCRARVACRSVARNPSTYGVTGFAVAQDVDQPGVRRRRGQLLEAVEARASGRTTAGTSPRAGARRRGRRRSRSTSSQREAERRGRSARERSASRAAWSCAVSGTTIRSAGIRIANITSAEAICASTDAAGISSRGNQTFLTSSAFAISEPVPSCTAGLEEPPDGEPRQHEQRVVRDVARALPEHREDERVDAHHQRAGRRTTRAAEGRALVAGADLAAAAACGAARRSRSASRAAGAPPSGRRR